jgi:Fe2+ transport system protein B
MNYGESMFQHHCKIPDNYEKTKNRKNVKRVALIGLESSGKSAVFRNLTRSLVPDEQNFPGSTIAVKKKVLGNIEIIDTPGIRFQSDAVTSKLAIQQFENCETVFLVCRAVDFEREFNQLLENLDLTRKKVSLIVTFGDKLKDIKKKSLIEKKLGKLLKIPVFIVDSRSIDKKTISSMLNSIKDARPLPGKFFGIGGLFETYKPRKTVFESKPLVSIPISIFAIALLFAVPVFLANSLAEWVNPFAEEYVVNWFIASLSFLPGIVKEVLIGNYGLLTMGTYSFVWAFPVVLFISFFIALTNQTGLMDRITRPLNILTKKIGLSGRDVIPILTGFGCNVVAVLQSRSCSSCHRKNCVSYISFGSACSYQLGATLAVFTFLGLWWLLFPYLFYLSFISIIFLRVFSQKEAREYKEFFKRPMLSFIQRPSTKAVLWEMQITLKQFLFFAIPIFLLMCILASVLVYIGVFDILITMFGGVMALFKLPAESMLPIIFSAIRKDGILLFLNEGLREVLNPWQVFIGVYFASTLSACSITVYTIAKEFGIKKALKLSGRQAFISVISTLLLVFIFSMSSLI